MDNKVTTKDKKDVEINNEQYYIPNTDITETENDFLMMLEMPGISKENVSINVEDDVLTIETNKDFSEKASAKCITQEFALQNYKRSFTLNYSIDVEKIEAEMENGILKLTLPKSEKLKPRKIAVKSA